MITARTETQERLIVSGEGIDFPESRKETLLIVDEQKATVTWRYRV